MQLSRRAVSAALSALLVTAPALSTAQPGLSLDPELRALAEREAPALLETLRLLTAIDSGTGHAPGMGALAKEIEKFAQAIGGQVLRVTPAASVVGPNLVITFPGKGQRRVMLMSHMDTVYPAGSAAQRPFRIVGKRAYAPGIADDKGGIALFLHAMRLLQARGFHDCAKITLVFNSDEERGTVGSRDLIRAEAGAHDVVLSGEPTGENESLVMGTSGVASFSARVSASATPGGPARPIEELADLVMRSRDTQRLVRETRMNWTQLRAEDTQALVPASAEHRQITLTFRVKGRASHAGVSPEEGVNALVEMAALVGRVSEVAAAQSRWQWGWRQAAGGQVSNVIPERASATLEIAVPAGQDVPSVLQLLRQAAETRLLPKAEVTQEVIEGAPQGLKGSAEAFASADVRIPTVEAFDQLKENGTRLAMKARFPGSAITLAGGVGFPPFNATEEAKSLATLASDINRALGGRPLRQFPRTFGATDAAWAAQSGKPVLEGFGLPGGGYHTTDDEYILVEPIGRRIALAAEMVRSVCRR